MASVVIDGVSVHLAHPESAIREWIGQDELMEQIMACWLTIAPEDQALCPRLVGQPGLGKTTLAMAAAARRGQAVYVQQCTSDTRPEDLIVTPVLGEGGGIAYHASPLVSAMVEGGISILDEANRMSEKSWASLAALLDHRRSVESVIAGIKISAHPEFRCCVTVNDDASTYEIPDYIMSRIQPTIELGFPSREDEMRILRYNIPFADEALLALTVDFLQRAHGLGLGFSIRDGVNAIRYAAKRQASGKWNAKEAWKQGIEGVLGKDALDLDRLASEKRGFRRDGPHTDLSEFFGGDEDAG